MIVAVIGIGKVGWPLVANLSMQTGIDKVLVSSRSEDSVEALIMDIASANPSASEKVCFATKQELSGADIVILTSGAQIVKGESATDILSTNIKITRTFLLDLHLKPTAILIGLATPVDDITVFLSKHSGLPSGQVFGFGGDLDRNRLRYVLRKNGLICDKTELVGEHGANAIPVYPGEASYDRVASEVRGFLRTVTTLAGETKNLATSLLLSELVESIVKDTGKTHYLCGFHPEYNIYLTWGFKVGRTGIGLPNEINVLGKAKIDLDNLIASRLEKDLLFAVSN